MAEALQGFQPDRMTSMIWTVLAGWIVWPILCGFLGASRGQTRKGFMHGLVWGPFGVIFILASKRKYECPTCGGHTLSAELHSRLAVMPAAPPPMARPAAVVESPSPVPDRRASAKTATQSTAPSKSVVEEACTGYSAEESARLLAWVNQQADSLGIKRPLASGNSTQVAAT
ncbi:MAG: hypothetical protein IPK83_04790 [Planctomycetes bacterium]|nr:hypothetical protein [Planctomycetota bacterium]